MRSSNLKYSEKLDHLRLAACLLVILFHTYHPVYNWLTGATGTAAYAQPVNPLSVFVVDGHTGIGLFLTLSGFLFARICKSGAFSVKNFYLNRFLRIYPLFIVILLIAIVFGNAPNPWPSFIGSLLTLQNTPNAVHIDSLNHLWTISVELQFYLLFPLLLWLYRCQHGMTLLLLFMGIDIFALAICYAQDSHILSLAYATTLGRINQCIIGMMLGFNLDKLEVRLKHPKYLLLSTCALSGLLMLFHNCGGTVFGLTHPMWIVFPTLEGIAWAAVIAGYVSCTGKLPAKLSRVLALGGALSYSIYIWHFYFCITLYPLVVPLVMNVNHAVLWLLPLQKMLLANPGATAVMIGLFVVFPATLLLSIFTYNFIEVPFFNLRRKYVFLDGDRSAAAAQEHLSLKTAIASGKLVLARTLKMTAWATVCVVVLALTGEVACRSMGVKDSLYLQPDERLGFRYLPGKTVNWQIEGYSNDAISSAGLRDIEHALEKPPGVKRILILGDSMVEGLQVPLDKIAARRLEAKLNAGGCSKVEVMNAACSNFSLGQSAIMYDQLAKTYQPDEVVLVYSARAADVNYRYSQDFSVVSRPYFYLKDNLLKEDSSLLPDKRFCAVSRYLLKNSRFASWLLWQDFQLALQSKPYGAVRTFALSTLRNIVCQNPDYPLPDRGLVRNAVLSFLNRVVRMQGAHLTLCALPCMETKERSTEYAEVKVLGFQEDFSVIDLNDSFQKAGPTAYIKYHFSAIGHDLMAENMCEFLKSRESQSVRTGIVSKPGSSTVPM